MASVLYRAGTSHIIDGVQCEMVRVEIDQYESHISSGWSADLPGKSADQESDTSGDDVRQAAKEAGIEGWDTKRIKTLRAALEA